MQRRAFLKLAAGVGTAFALPSGLGGCGGKNGNTAPGLFPQGIASGDPRPHSVVLWTRVDPSAFADADDSIVTVEMAADTQFTTLILQNRVELSPEQDHTLRLLVRALQSDTIYYFRFILPDGRISPVGRTWTAPDPNQPVEMRFGIVNCQDRIHGFYGAYRRMLQDDVAAAPADQLRFVLHLGDFIYETRNAMLQQPLDAGLTPLPDALTDRTGKVRAMTPFPDGAVSEDGVHYAESLADYRHVYRTYLSDPDLQAARARWPFIHVWDDHEFSDDAWQSEANYSDTGVNASTDEPSQPRRVAASRAWFEYIPVNLSFPDEQPEDLWEARDFEMTQVGTSRNTFADENGLAPNADNLAAINALRLYRGFRFGTLLDLALTDNRSYRSDHAIPEDISGRNSLFFHSRLALPLNLLHELDAGRTANDGDPDTLLFVGDVVLNPRQFSAPGTLLGPQQKAWWKNWMRNSTARWRIWGNSVPLLRLKVDLSSIDEILPDIVLSGDSWDGYRTERNELMAFLGDAGISNVVSLSGDLHAHFAGTVTDDYDAPLAEQETRCVEFVCGAVSSVSQFAAVERLSRRDAYSPREEMLRALITYDARPVAGENADPIVPNINATLLHGARAALGLASTHDRATLATLHREVNPQLRYADTHAHGFARVHVQNDQIIVSLVSIDSITQDTGATGPLILREARFTVPAAADSTLTLEDPQFTGDLPFPWSLG